MAATSSSSQRFIEFIGWESKVVMENDCPGILRDSKWFPLWPMETVINYRTIKLYVSNISNDDQPKFILMAPPSVAEFVTSLQISPQAALEGNGLLIAACCGNETTMKWLLERGAPYCMTDQKNQKFSNLIVDPEIRKRMEELVTKIQLEELERRKEEEMMLKQLNISNAVLKQDAANPFLCQVQGASTPSAVASPSSNHQSIHNSPSSNTPNPLGPPVTFGTPNVAIGVLPAYPPSNLPVAGVLHNFTPFPSNNMKSNSPGPLLPSNVGHLPTTPAPNAGVLPTYIPQAQLPDYVPKQPQIAAVPSNYPIQNAPALPAPPQPQHVYVKPAASPDFKLYPHPPHNNNHHNQHHQYRVYVIPAGQHGGIDSSTIRPPKGFRISQFIDKILDI